MSLSSSCCEVGADLVVLDGLGDPVDALVVARLQRPGGVVDVHLGEARARRLQPHGATQLVDERVPDQRAVVVRRDERPVGVGGHAQHRVILVDVGVAAPQLDLVGRLGEPGRRLPAHVVPGARRQRRQVRERGRPFDRLEDHHGRVQVDLLVGRLAAAVAVDHDDREAGGEVEGARDVERGGDPVRGGAADEGSARAAAWWRSAPAVSRRRAWTSRPAAGRRWCSGSRPPTCRHHRHREPVPERLAGRREDDDSGPPDGAAGGAARVACAGAVAVAGEATVRSAAASPPAPRPLGRCSHRCPRRRRAGRAPRDGPHAAPSVTSSATIAVTGTSRSLISTATPS